MKKIFFIAIFIAFCSFSANLSLFSQLSTTFGVISSGVKIPQVLITEVYGGGGNSGAPYNLDFVELFNTSSASISLSGWSLQYFTSAGATPSKIITFPETAVIRPMKHFLLALSGGTNGSALPGIDMSENAVLSATSAKVVLFSTVEAQSVTDSVSIANNAGLIDYVPYGKSAIPIWGSAMNKDCSATMSASRNKLSDGSYIYTGNIGTDFAVVTPSPEFSGVINAFPELQQQQFLKLTSGGIQLNLTESGRVILSDVSGKLLYSSILSSGVSQLYISDPGVYVLNISGKIHKFMYHP